jgi:hypothetical protein
VVRKVLVVLGVLTVAGTVVRVAEQSPARPAFEVASIKQSDSLERGGRSGWEPGGRFRGVNVPGVILVQIAYGTSSRTLLRYQLDGVPGWLASARYDITGKIRTDLATTDLAELGSKGPLYLRSLLEDRLQAEDPSRIPSVAAIPARARAERQQLRSALSPFDVRHRAHDDVHVRIPGESHDVRWRHYESPGRRTRRQGRPRRR